MSGYVQYARSALVGAAFLIASAAQIGARADSIGKSNAVPNDVDLALVLAVDASQSMDDDEQAVQRSGYVEAIASKEVAAAIRYGQRGRIAVTYFEWGSMGRQIVVAPWAIIDGPEAAKAFTRQIAMAPRNNLQRTSISDALAFAGTLLTQSGVQATRRVVDISGDGRNNQGPLVTTARDALAQQGVTINGLPIIMKGEETGWSAVNLDLYYEDCVIVGEGSFMIPVNGIANFGMALKMKLVMEIAGLVPKGARVLPAAARPLQTCSFSD